MISNYFVLFVSLVSVGASEYTCYWNRECPFLLYSTKTPYDTVRGELRDYADPQNCEAISIWSLNRHGNRNPGNSVTEAIRVIAALKQEIVASYDVGRSQLCAQDIEEFRRWSWNETLEVSASDLTGTGYEEIFNIAQRIRERYPHLMTGEQGDYYFRSTTEQRTITSAIAFVHGLTDGTNRSLVIDDVRTRDDVIRPYEYCDNYQENAKGAPAVTEEVEAYARTAEYIAVQNAVQQRLGIPTQLSADDIYTLYEICRFYRSWTATHQSPWCSVFTDQDLVVLEYRDDVRHYHRNGYGSWINVRLGAPPMKDLYDNFEAAVQGRGRNIVAYFTHDTMLEMSFCALGMFKDASPIRGSFRDVDRLWRTSNIAVFSNNLIAVLNRCQESGTQTNRVQFYHNEKVTELCPLSGCTWEQFQEKFQPFTSSTLDFCSLNYPEPEIQPEQVEGSAVVPKGMIGLLTVQAIVIWFWRK